MISKIVLIGGFLLFYANSSLQSQDLASEKELQPWINAEKETVRAKSDDMISIVLLTVQNADKEAFETWIDEVLYHALYKSKNPMKKAQLNAVRWFEPVNQNEDGSWHYCWIMDPLIPKTNYDIPLFLKQEYGEEQGEKHWEKYQSMVHTKVVAFRQTSK